MEEPATVSMDKICCMCCSDKILIVGRESGVLHQYDIKELRLAAKETIQCRPQSKHLLVSTTALIFSYDVGTSVQPFCSMIPISYI